jgi:hypothetical protein
VTPEVRSVTFVGVDRLVVVPSPRRPPSLLPQHSTPPAAVNAHEWELPSDIDDTAVIAPADGDIVAVRPANTDKANAGSATQ